MNLKLFVVVLVTLLLGAVSIGLSIAILELKHILVLEVPDYGFVSINHQACTLNLWFSYFHFTRFYFRILSAAFRADYFYLTPIFHTILPNFDSRIYELYHQPHSQIYQIYYFIILIFS